jgi:aminopeptidase
MPLITETYRQVIRSGGNPFVLIQDQALQEIMLKEGSDKQLQHVSAPARLFAESYDCRIAIRGANNTRMLSGVDPKKMQIRQAANKELMAITMKRGAQGNYRWVSTMYPTDAHAQEADMSLNEFRLCRLSC